MDQELLPWLQALTGLLIAALLAGVALYLRGLKRQHDAEEALRESEAKAVHIVNTARDGIITIDESGLIETFNPAAEAMFGYPAQEMIGHNIAVLIPPPDRGRKKANYIHDSAGRELLGIRQDGSSFPLDLVLSEASSKQRRLFSVVVRDRTERKKMEAALQAERNFISAVLESAGALLIVMDHDGRIVRFNRACEELTGYSFGEIKGQPVWQALAAPEDMAAMEAAVRAMLGGAFPSATESVWTVRDGSRRSISFSNTALRDEFGRLDFAVSIGVDMTERKALEAQLVHAQKMEAVGRLAGGVAHDFNNLLTAITGYSSLVLHSLAENDPARQDVEEIQKASDRAAALTRQLLALSRKQVMSPKVVDLNTIVRDMERMLGRLLGDEIEVELRLAPALAPVKADPSQMEQVLLNLAMNARDAMTGKGKLSISTGNAVLSPGDRPTDPPLAPGTYVFLRIADTGSGIGADVLPHIFEPFFTTKSMEKGTGLGLSTVYGIVSQSGGGIAVASELSQGAEFTVYLPPAAAAEAAAGAPRDSAAVARGSETILLVEDEDGVREPVRRVLEQNGYTVIDARTGKEALQLSRAHRGAIHLLITDVVMPGMRGPDLARELTAARPLMRVLYMSGDTHRTSAPPGGMLLEKPFAPETVAQKVRQLLDSSPLSAGATGGQGI